MPVCNQYRSSLAHMCDSNLGFRAKFKLSCIAYERESLSLGHSMIDLLGLTWFRQHATIYLNRFIPRAQNRKH